MKNDTLVPDWPANERSSEIRTSDEARQHTHGGGRSYLRAGAGQSAGHESLAGTGRAVEQYTARRHDAKAIEDLRVQER